MGGGGGRWEGGMRSGGLTRVNLSTEEEKKRPHPGYCYSAMNTYSYHVDACVRPPPGELFSHLSTWNPSLRVRHPIYLILFLYIVTFSFTLFKHSVDCSEFV